QYRPFVSSRLSFFFFFFSSRRRHTRSKRDWSSDVCSSDLTSMLDPEGRDELMAIVADIKQDKALTVISITHDLNEAAEADRMLVFKEGQIIKEGRPDDIFTYGNELTEVGLEVPFSEQQI